ncbi:MAG: aquaporin [Candidatus Tumulicola sp.]
MNRYIAEFVGTFVLMFVGIGTALYDGKVIGHAGIALAFGLTLAALVYAIGPISGCHINPAVTIGLCVAKRFSWADSPWYILAQLLGGTCGWGTLVLVLVLAGKYDPSMAAAVANGFDTESAIGATMVGALIVEAIATFVLMFTILGATSAAAPAGFAGIAIGFALAVANFVAIPVTNASINPARSLGPALYAGAPYLGELWLFFVAPILGAVVAAVVWNLIGKRAPA